MIRIDIRELKEHATEIMRRVREEGETYEVTYHGRPIARVVPVDKPPHQNLDPSFWEDWRRLAREISASWPEGTSAPDAIREDRRDL
jgi:prevent-host-death family protein